MWCLSAIWCPCVFFVCVGNHWQADPGSPPKTATSHKVSSLGTFVQERTFDEDGLRRRAGCVCFNRDRSQVTPGVQGFFVFVFFVLVLLGAFLGTYPVVSNARMPSSAYPTYMLCFFMHVCGAGRGGCWSPLSLSLFSFG